MKTPSPGSRQHNPTLALFSLSGVLALLAGCASEPESHVVSAPPPAAPVMVAGTGTVMTTSPLVAPMTTTTQTTQQTPNGTIVTTQTQPVSYVVTQAPPVVQTEVVSVRPSSSHIWIAGYWTWRNNQYQWVAGHWEVPPYANATWVPPRWQPESGAYRFYEGYWN
jgi:hypothetical protein